MLAIHHYPLCPFSRKARIVLREKNLDFELFIEKYWERNIDFMTLNPRGDTPVLKTENGMVIYGRNSLFEFLEEAYPENNLLGKNLSIRLKVRKVNEWFDEKFYNEVTKYMINEKILKPIRGLGEPNSDFIRAARKNLSYHMQYITHLLQNHSYLATDNVTLADFSAASQLSVLDFINDVPWDRYPKVKSWYAIIKSRPSFKSILRDVVPGIYPPDHYSNPDF